jgi:Ca2+-binding EF-hand superfamily protein
MGDKLRLLDQDNDGEFSVDELRQAVSKVLNRKISAEDAEDLIKLLDKDNDGKGVVLLFHNS